MLAAWQRLPAVYTRPSLSFSRSSSSLSPWVHYTPILLYSYTPILLYSYTPILLYSAESINSSLLFCSIL